jgi:hypothetical protein
MSKEMLELADRLENHVVSRLPGSAPVVENGAWQMMLDAAKMLRASAVAEPVRKSMWQQPQYDPELSLLGAVKEMAASLPDAHPAPAAPVPADQVKCGPMDEDEWKDQRIASLEAYVAQLKEQLVAASLPAPEAAPTIDNVPSCGQENDYRRAKTEAAKD